MSKSPGRHWPLSIIGIFIFLSIMLFGILYVSFKYIPANSENKFQMAYQEVDKSFNDIYASQKIFDENFDVAFITQNYSDEKVETKRANGEIVYFDHAISLKGKNSFKMNIKDKSKKGIDYAVIKLLLTRYDTGEYDIEVGMKAIGDGTYKSDEFTVDKPGRWKIAARVDIAGKRGYFERGVFAR